MTNTICARGNNIIRRSAESSSSSVRLNARTLLPSQTPSSPLFKKMLKVRSNWNSRPILTKLTSTAMGIWTRLKSYSVWKRRALLGCKTVEMWREKSSTSLTWTKIQRSHFRNWRLSTLEMSTVKKRHLTLQFNKVQQQLNHFYLSLASPGNAPTSAASGTPAWWKVLGKEIPLSAGLCPQDASASGEPSNYKLFLIRFIICH